MRSDFQFGRRHLTLGALATFLALGLSACASFQDASWQATLRDAASLNLPESGASATPTAQWWRKWGDEQLSGNWELDSFGRNRAALQAALG